MCISFSLTTLATLEAHATCSQIQRINPLNTRIEIYSWRVFVTVMRARAHMCALHSFSWSRNAHSIYCMHITFTEEWLHSAHMQSVTTTESTKCDGITVISDNKVIIHVFYRAHIHLLTKLHAQAKKQTAEAEHSMTRVPKLFIQNWIPRVIRI